MKQINVWSFENKTPQGLKKELSSEFLIVNQI